MGNDRIRQENGAIAGQGFQSWKVSCLVERGLSPFFLLPCLSSGVKSMGVYPRKKCRDARRGALKRRVVCQRKWAWKQAGAPQGGSACPRGDGCVAVVSDEKYVRDAGEQRRLRS